MPNLNFAESINSALVEAMKKDDKLICYGLGTTDPKGIFGTTLNLEKLFGKKRVFDVPCSENSLTGVSIGAALGGVRSVVTHQRLDFFLLAMDQLVNSAAKWYYMFGSQISVPITIRLIIGRGWGQGPTHSQNLQSWFAHIPGLKVVMPTFPSDAKQMLLKSIRDPNPVIFLEHRWLYSLSENFYKKENNNTINCARVINNGKDITIVAMSYMVIEAIKAQKFLKKFFSINAEIIDLRSIKPIDFSTISKSIKKTKKLLVLDTGPSSCSVSSEIIAEMSISKNIFFKKKPKKIAMPDVPEPTSYSLTKNFYKTYKDIIYEVLEILDIPKKNYPLQNIFVNENQEHDQISSNFFGPF